MRQSSERLWCSCQVQCVEGRPPSANFLALRLPPTGRSAIVFVPLPPTQASRGSVAAGDLDASCQGRFFSAVEHWYTCRAHGQQPAACSMTSSRCELQQSFPPAVCWVRQQYPQNRHPMQATGSLLSQLCGSKAGADGAVAGVDRFLFMLLRCFLGLSGDLHSKHPSAPKRLPTCQGSLTGARGIRSSDLSTSTAFSAAVFSAFFLLGPSASYTCRQKAL